MMKLRIFHFYIASRNGQIIEKLNPTKIVINTNHLSIFFNIHQNFITQNHHFSIAITPLPSVQIHQALPQLVPLCQQRAGRQHHGPRARGPKALAVAAAPGCRPDTSRGWGSSHEKRGRPIGMSFIYENIWK